jgi:hypothetical protein
MTPTLSRRDWLRLSSAGVVGFSMSGWLEALAADAAKHPQRRRSCILLWMNGGPSQTDTFDLKPGHANGGPFKEIATSVPGVRISEHLPKVAKCMDQMVLVRSMRTKESDHGRASYLLRTGRVPSGPVQYPTLGSALSKELGNPEAELPNFVSIAPYRFLSPAAYGPGFLGPQYAPLVVGENMGFGPQQQDYDQALKVEDLDLPGGVSAKQAATRVQLLDEMEQDFLSRRSGPAGLSHRTAYQRAVALMRSAAAKAFNLKEEPMSVRDGYGRNLFGQGCLLARRLVEHGVPFVEVTLSSAPGVNNGIGWDTHQDNFNIVQKLSQVLDQAWAMLMNDLRQRGLLDSTLIVWMGEFGRTPKIVRNQNGRDHWANSWTTVLAGGGLKRGGVIGKTSKDGMEVTERPVSVPDLLATVCQALGVDSMKQNASNVGRPIRIVEPTATPIKEIVA